MSEENENIPQQITAGHFWMLHAKNIPRLASLEEGDPALNTARQDFFSGAYSGLAFLKTSIGLREENRKNLIDSVASDILDRQSLDKEYLVGVLGQMADALGTNLAEMESKRSEMQEEVLFEIRKAVVANDKLTDAGTQASK